MRAGSHTLPVVLALVGKIAEDSYNDSFEERHSLLQVAAEQEAARDAGEEDEGPLEVEGFLFKRLLERKPEKRQELLTLRDHLLASSSSSDTSGDSLRPYPRRMPYIQPVPIVLRRSSLLHGQKWCTPRQQCWHAAHWHNPPDASHNLRGYETCMIDACSISCSKACQDWLTRLR